MIYKTQYNASITTGQHRGSTGQFSFARDLRNGRAVRVVVVRTYGLCCAGWSSPTAARSLNLEPLGLSVVQVKLTAIQTRAKAEAGG